MAGSPGRPKDDGPAGPWISHGRATFITPQLSASTVASVLVVDDQPDILEALRLLLKGQGFEVETALSPTSALGILDRRDFDAMLLDMNYSRDTTSGREGLDLLGVLRNLEPDLPVIVMTAWGTVDNAVEAMQRGARDYVEKPWDNVRLTSILTTQIELGRALRRTRHLERENTLLRRNHFPSMIAESPRMQPVLEMMERIGPSNANVLITGEHGTGKELVAQWLHSASPRAQRSFVPVNMGGLADGIFESELFGHVKGAFTDAKADRIGRFELADGGTIFLDEIGNVSLASQSKLLRVLQTGEVERVGSSKARKIDARVLAATNTELDRAVADGRFREDLLFRLNTIEIRLPPLRERRDDIGPLATHFLLCHAKRYAKTLSGFDAAAMRQLLDHAWPGNIRELDHVIERAVLMATTGSIRPADLLLKSGGGPTRIEELTLEEVEKTLIQKALGRYDGNVSQAAKALGLSRSALYRRIATYGL